MHQGMPVFAQVMAQLPLTAFRRCVAAHRDDYKVQEFSPLDQFFDRFCAIAHKISESAAFVIQTKKGFHRALGQRSPKLRM